MKISTNKKSLIIFSTILIVLLLIIFINYHAYFSGDSFNYSEFIIAIISCIIACAFFCIKIEFKDKINSVFSIISFILSILFSYMIVELLNQNSLFALNLNRLMFNFIIIIFLHLFIYAISNKLNLTIILSNSIVLTIGITNYVVTCFRGTPLVPWDILSFKTAIHVAGTYTFQINNYLLLAISLFLLILSIGTKVKYYYKNKKANTILRFIIILIILICTLFFYKSDIIDRFDFETNLWEPRTESINNGFLASFVKQTKNLFNEKPENYSISKIENILLETNENSNNYINTNNELDNPNIIVIMSESFSDLTVNGSFETSEECIPYFKSLEKNTIRGYTYVSVFGGQTPNSEWEFLTNNSMAFMPHRTVPYQQYIRTKSYSLANTLKSQGYTANAIHPWYGSGYRRNAIYPLLGFDSFESLETLNNLDYLRTYPTDLSIYKYITNQFENKNSDEKIFDFVVTMQNHSGYDLPGYDSTIFLEDIDNCPRVEQYLSLIKESDLALEYLIDYFKNYDEKTIILLFGDHQPPYLEDEFWNTIMQDSSDEKTKYITPFVLWANYDIDEEYIDKISLNYLSMLLLDTANLQTTPYIEFLRNIRSKLPVITGNGYIDNDGNYYTFDSENEYSQLLHDYQIIQYNNVFDRKNIVNDFFKPN